MPLFKDPYPNTPAETRIRVQGDIDPTDYRYLFRKVLGVRGCQEPIIGTLIKALVTEIRKPKYGIIDSYDDDNFGKIQSIIDRVNFNSVGVYADRKQFGEAANELRAQDDTGQQVMARRTDHRTPRSTSASHERDRKTKAHPSDTHTPNITTDPKSKVGGRKRSAGKETTKDRTET